MFRELAASIQRNGGLLAPRLFQIMESAGSLRCTSRLTNDKSEDRISFAVGPDPPAVDRC